MIQWLSISTPTWFLGRRGRSSTCFVSLLWVAVQLLRGLIALRRWFLLRETSLSNRHIRDHENLLQTLLSSSSNLHVLRSSVSERSKKLIVSEVDCRHGTARSTTLTLPMHTVRAVRAGIACAEHAFLHNSGPDAASRAFRSVIKKLPC